jgi:putative hydrolase of the HAD superfamily
MGIRAVLFDMGGTIETFWSTPELRMAATPALAQLLSESGIEPGLNNRELFEIVTSGLDSYHKWSLITLEELSPAQVWNEFIFCNYPDFKEKIACKAEELMIFTEIHYYHRELRPEVPQVLETIRKSGLKIGLISNVCSHGLVPQNLKNYGIYDYFNPIVLSSEYGRRKPDASIFHYAARLANVATSECLYVGDRIARDIVGSKRAGFKRAVQIINEFDHGESDAGAQPDDVIHNMTELLDILKEEAQKPEIIPSTEVRAFLFDAGDILYYRPERGRNLQAFLEEQGVAKRKISPEKKEALKQQAYHGKITQDLHRESLLRLYGLTDPAVIECGKAKMDLDDNNVAFFEGVAETLLELKRRGFMLGIITDTAMPVHVKLEWFERGGFGNVWDSIISSKDIGFQKPDPRIYQTALNQLGLTVNQAVFVGHNPAELDGARAVGMKTIAFNHDESSEADHFIEKFEDLLKVPVMFSEEYLQQGIRK